MRLDSCLGFIWSCISVIQHTDESRQHLSAPRGASATENDNMFIMHTSTGHIYRNAMGFPAAVLWHVLQLSILFEGAGSSPGESFTIFRSLNTLNAALRKEKELKSPVRAPRHCSQSWPLDLQEGAFWAASPPETCPRAQRQMWGYQKTTIFIFPNGKDEKVFVVVVVLTSWLGKGVQKQAFLYIVRRVKIATISLEDNWLISVIILNAHPLDLAISYQGIFPIEHLSVFITELFRTANKIKRQIPIQVK